MYVHIKWFIQLRGHIVTIRADFQKGMESVAENN